MGVLADFVRTEAEHLKAEAKKREDVLTAWLEAVERLYDQIRQWIRDADSGSGLLTIGSGPRLTRQEALLGFYEVDVLTISFGGRLSSRRVDVVPRARYVSATIRPPGREARRADGMVEIKSGSIAAYYLFWLQTDVAGEWYIRNVDQWNADTEYGRVEPLDRDALEAAILSILR